MKKGIVNRKHSMLYVNFSDGSKVFMGKLREGSSAEVISRLNGLEKRIESGHRSGVSVFLKQVRKGGIGFSVRMIRARI